MRSLLQRLFGPVRAGRRTVTCYLRENGPIAYELDVFGRSPRERADAMMASELSWAWQSGTREWTHLTRISLSAFLADLESGVLLIAVEEDLPVDLSDHQVATWIRQFCRLQTTPLRAAVSVAGGGQILFVQQHATDAVNALLDAWGIDKRAAERKAYARLGPASLESVAARLAHAHPGA